MLALLIFCSFAAIGIFVSSTRHNGFYHFPFLLLITSIGFIGIQLLGLANSDFSYPSEFLLEYVWTVVFANFGVYFGFYLRRPAAKVSAPNSIRYNVNRLSFFSFITVAIAWLAFILLVQMIGGFQRFIGGGAYSIVWEGKAVQYTFAVQLVYVVMPVALAVWLRTKNRLAFAAFVLSMALALIYIFGLNRRLPFALVAVTIFLVAGLTLNIKVKGIYVLIALVIGVFVNNVFPLLRHSDFSTQKTTWTEILEAPGTHLLESGSAGDVRNGVVVIAGHQNIFDFQLGFGFLAKGVQDLVPSAIVGRDIKANILESYQSEKEIATKNTGFLINSNEYVTGPAWIFAQFWHFGVFFWILLGYIAASLWRKAQTTHSLPHLAWYTIFTTASMVAMVFSPGFMVPYLFRAALVYLPLFQFTKRGRWRA